MQIKAAAVMLLLSIVTVACKEKSTKQQLAFYRQLNTSIRQAHDNLTINMLHNLRELDEKSIDPKTMDKGLLWYHRAGEVFNASNEMIHYLEQIKAKFNTDSGRLLEQCRTTSEVFDATTTTEFQKNTTRYRQTLLQQNKDIITQLGFLTVLNDTLYSFTKNSNSLQCFIDIVRLQMDIMSAADAIITFCNRKVTSEILICEMQFPQIIIDSKLYHPGEKAIITATPASFSSNEKAVLMINNKKGSTDDSGVLSYSFNVNNKPGKHYVTATFNYIDFNTGQPTSIKKILSYEVE